MADKQNQNTKQIDNTTEDGYKQHLKEAVKDGSYFKDAIEWFSVKYINPTTEKTLLLIAFFLSVIVTYIIVTMVAGLLPLKQSMPIVLEERDSTQYLPIAKKLKDSSTNTTDEAIAKYLVINYLKERENHYYPAGDLIAYNQKFDVIKNNSTDDVFSEFQQFMSKTNSDSPIHYFGKNIKREITVSSFKFIRPDEKLFDFAKNILGKESVPKNVEIEYNVSTIAGQQVVKKSQLAKISFEFNGIQTNSEGKYLPLNFKVTSYKNYNN